MPGPGGGGQQINSLMDLMQPAATQQQPHQFGTLDQDAGYYMQPAPPLYSGGGVGAIGMGGGGGGSMFNPPQELARYFDPFGNPKIDDPRQVAAEAGTSVGQLASGLFPRGGAKDIRYEYPSDQGGFFTVEDLFGLTKRPVPVAGALRANGQPNMGLEQTSVPSIATHQMNAPSTNNWRLLGRGPGWIMRNSDLINTRAPEVQWGRHLGGLMGAAASAEHGYQPLSHTALGTGAAYGVPNLHSSGIAGWPGGSKWWSF